MAPRDRSSKQAGSRMGKLENVTADMGRTIHTLPNYIRVTVPRSLTHPVQQPKRQPPTGLEGGARSCSHPLCPPPVCPDSALVAEAPRIVDGSDMRKPREPSTSPPGETGRRGISALWYTYWRWPDGACSHTHPFPPPPPPTFGVKQTRNRTRRDGVFGPRRGSGFGSGNRGLWASIA